MIKLLICKLFNLEQSNLGKSIWVELIVLIKDKIQLYKHLEKKYPSGTCIYIDIDQDNINLIQEVKLLDFFKNNKQLYFKIDIKIPNNLRNYIIEDDYETDEAVHRNKCYCHQKVIDSLKKIKDKNIIKWINEIDLKFDHIILKKFISLLSPEYLTLYNNTIKDYKSDNELPVDHNDYISYKLYKIVKN